MVKKHEDQILDEVANQARKAAVKRRGFEVTKEQQKEFFEGAVQTIPPRLKSIFVKRALMGADKYGDDIFWMSKAELLKMATEELADYFVYLTVALIGDRFKQNLITQAENKAIQSVTEENE